MIKQSKRSFPIFTGFALPLSYFAIFTLFGFVSGILGHSDAFAKNVSPYLASNSPSADNNQKTAASQTEFAKIRQIVQEYFKQNPHYQEGDLIVRNEAQNVVDSLQKKGHVVRDPQAILDKTLSKGSFLAKVLRNGRQGEDFMHRISDYPLAYDQLDRLGNNPVGRRTVIDLVRGPDGYKMLQYMNNSRYGKNLGRMLSSDQAGGDYNKPTGKIYTAKQLTEAIWEQISSKPEKK